MHARSAFRYALPKDDEERRLIPPASKTEGPSESPNRGADFVLSSLPVYKR